MILIVTESQRDAHLVPVLGELLRRGHDVAVFDPAEVLTDTRVTITGSSSGQRHMLAWGRQTVDLSDVDSIWYRKPGHLRYPEGLAVSETDWLETECAHLIGGLWQATDAFWVSHPTAIRAAGRKIPQLALAASLGFEVPDYVITNEPDIARDFLRSDKPGAIVKVLGQPTLMSDGLGGVIYTHLVTEDDLAQIESVAHCPTFFQRFVTKRFDVRVSVFGDRLFAVAIDSDGHPGAKTDFRNVRPFELPHFEIELPPLLRDRCFELVRRLGLSFGAIDLLQTPDGEFVFLEINPNGQWYWLERITGLPLASAMCDLLETGVEHRPMPRSGLADQVAETDTGRRSTVFEVGQQTMALPVEAQMRLAEEPGWVPAHASRVWAEDFSGSVRFHLGDFDE